MTCVTLKLDTIDLDPNMRWPDRHQFSPVGATNKRTLAGNLVSFRQAVSKGRPITLVAGENFGWLTVGQVEAVQALADQETGTFPLQIGSEFFTVQFRHTDPPAFEADSLLGDLDETTGASNDPRTTFYTATIKLETV